MDELVLRAMARWPDVPAVYGWLRLDRRGQWLLVDRGIPGFDEALHGQGSPITSPPILDFIGRNYAHDDAGRWYWQNGPQRVYVDIDVAPYVLRVFGDAPSQRLATHTGYPVSRVDRAMATADGTLLLQTDLGPGVLDDRDLAALHLELDEDGAQRGRLVLMGEHAVTPAPHEPASALGFIPRPRRSQTPD